MAKPDAHSLPTESHLMPDDLRVLFRASVTFSLSRTQMAPKDSVCVEGVPMPHGRPLLLRSDTLPCLTIPSPRAVQVSASGVPRVLVCAEGRDTRIAESVTELLAPARCELGLVHVTWLPGLVPSPLDDTGLDDPQPSALLAYQGAREALIDRAEELRRAGFTVSTHLRVSRRPAEAINALATASPTALVVLGLGRHGAGIGVSVMRDAGLPVLFVASRAGN